MMEIWLLMLEEVSLDFAERDKHLVKARHHQKSFGNIFSFYLLNKLLIFRTYFLFQTIVCIKRG